MKTKYIKIDPKNQLEGKEYIQMHPIMVKNRVEQRNVFPELEWVEEVPDREEEMREMLNKARSVIAKLKRSMLVHPDHEEGSEFDDMTTSAQEMENEIGEYLES